ncbi:MAG: hypothetical protein II399_02435 [Lachnospiraceae bacterium]|nr:hypothetical protein [Lachnospiraceae bacterium]
MNKIEYYNTCLDRFNAVEGDLVSADEYKELIRSLLDIDVLYCVASPTGKTNRVAKPLAIAHPQFGPSMNIFTSVDKVRPFAEYYGLRDFIELPRKSSLGDFYSVFHVCKVIGVRNIIVNEGSAYVGIPVKHLFDFGNLTDRGIIIADDVQKYIDGSGNIDFSYVPYFKLGV